MYPPVEEYHHSNVMSICKCNDHHQMPPLMTGANEVHLTWEEGDNTTIDVNRLGYS